MVWKSQIYSIQEIGKSEETFSAYTRSKLWKQVVTSFFSVNAESPPTAVMTSQQYLAIMLLGDIKELELWKTLP